MKTTEATTTALAHTGYGVRADGERTVCVLLCATPHTHVLRYR